MKNKAGALGGFILGAVGFLLMFKLIFLEKLGLEDELAPGAVVMVAVVIGLFLAFIGGRIQHYIAK